MDISQALLKGASGSVMAGFQIVDAINSSVPLKTVLFPGSTYQVKFPDVGDLAYRIVLNTDLSLSIDTTNVRKNLQKIVFFIQQPPGGNCMVTVENVKWINNKCPFIDSRIGYFSIFEVFKLDKILIGNFMGEIYNG